MIRALFMDTRYSVVEALDGSEGLRRAREGRLQAIFLDLIMPGMSGFEVLSRLKADPETRDIPVIIITSKVLSQEDQSRLAKEALAVLSKEALSGQAAAHRIREVLAAAADQRRGKEKTEI